MRPGVPPFVRIPLDFPPRPHEAWLGRGVLARAGEAVAASVPPGVCALVTDARVAATPHAAEVGDSLRRAGFAPVTLVLPEGERAKALAEVARLWDAFAAAGIERRSPVVAVGGGAVGDAAGFAAASWMRGVPLVHVPTTLLAMADSAIGGKTAVNLGCGKNLVGAFHQPSAVLADVGTLATLPDRELRSGLAEVVKCAVLADRDRLARLRDEGPRVLARDDGALTDWIAFAIRTKAEHVRGDPLDSAGPRALLNLGHTTAHALETESGHGTLLHGEAVAVGLVVAARLAARRGACPPTLVGEVEGALAACGLSTALPRGTDPAALADRTRRDKKREGGRLRMVLPTAASAAVADVSREDLLAALSS